MVINSYLKSALKTLRIFNLIKYCIYKINYLLGPRDEFQKKKWESLHKKNYHPSIEDSVKRIIDNKNQNIYLFDEMGKMLGININVENKTILEIGFGGGWYLAQMLFRNASKVIGFEITEAIITKAKKIFQSLNLKNYEFFEVHEEFLNILDKNSIDIIFETTVFQHISEKSTKNYLLSSKNVLKNDGIILCQFLMNDVHPIKRSYTRDSQGIVYYSHKEILKLVDECNLRIEKYSDYEWRDEHNGYWRLYIIKNILDN